MCVYHPRWESVFRVLCRPNIYGEWRGLGCGSGRASEMRYFSFSMGEFCEHMRGIYFGDTKDPITQEFLDVQGYMRLWWGHLVVPWMWLTFEGP